MATKKDDTLYLRNGRPNSVVFHFGGIRYKLEHRGNRQDSISLPAEAANDQQIQRWIKIGQLEKISKESFMQLGARQVDVLPNTFLKKPMREPGVKGIELVKADADAGGGRTQLRDRDVTKSINPSPEWGGELMSTEEELETLDISSDKMTPNYPSKYRDEN